MRISLFNGKPQATTAAQSQSQTIDISSRLVKKPSVLAAKPWQHIAAGASPRKSRNILF